MQDRKRTLLAWISSILMAVVAGAAIGRASESRNVSPPRVPADEDSALEVTAAAPPAPQVPECPFAAGSHARDTLGQGLAPRNIPIKHVIVLTQENRSFDHYFGRLSEAGQPDSEPIPASFGNPDAHGRWVRPFHLPATCVPRDPPHQWESMHAHWDHGRMDRFVVEAATCGIKGVRCSSRRPAHEGRDPGEDDDDDATAGGRFVLGYYDQRDLPFYYYLANTFAIADRFFASAMAGTWPNRQFLYTATAQKRPAPTAMLTGARTIFDNLDAAGVSWAVYTDGPARQDCIGWPARGARGVQSIQRLMAALRRGTLPAVVFVDPSAEDEHPPADVQRGEGWARELFLALTASPAWSETVLFLTYDEGGGFFDHVAPPPACPPSPDRTEYRRRGVRVPLLVVSPWARRHAVSHVVHDHTSLLRFIELLFDLPALSARDANADALLDAFDFQSPPRLTIGVPPASGRGGCRPGRAVASSALADGSTAR